MPSASSVPSSGSPASTAALRRPALAWALLHVPLVLALYGPALAGAVSSVPAPFRLLLLPSFPAAACFLALVAWAVALPFGFRPAAYRVAAPLVTGLATVLLVLDSQIQRAIGFHINGLVISVLLQPRALQETGIPLWEAGVFALVAVAWLAGEVVAGGWFLRRFASRRPVFRWAALLLALGAAERVYVAALMFAGGPAVFAAGRVLPAQVPLRMNKTLARLTGRPDHRWRDPFEGAAARSARELPGALSADSIRFARTPDVLLVLVESIRADALDSMAMPLLSRRAERGAVFERHYATASSTHYALFSLFFGLEAHKLEAVMGAGRSPLLFGAMTRSGYRTRFLAASSVDWMGLRSTVFGDVADAVETEFPGIGATRDSAMVVRAREWVEAAGPEPLFLILFFDGTHFHYTFPERAVRFRPYWDGGSTLEAARVAGPLIHRRALNAAVEVDLKLDGFLTWFEARRGRPPLVIVTGDHGEEYREHGRLGHASGVVNEQVHVPMVLLGEGVRSGRFRGVTSHVDVVPTLFGLLGEAHPPRSWSDGYSMFEVPDDRFVLTGVGWEPRYAAVGRDLKVTFSGLNAGLGGATVTDPWDRPVPDADARFAAAVPAILRAFTRH